MTTALVLIDHDRGVMAETSLQAVAFAGALGLDVEAVLIGADAEPPTTSCAAGARTPSPSWSSSLERRWSWRPEPTAGTRCLRISERFSTSRWSPTSHRPRWATPGGSPAFAGAAVSSNTSSWRPVSSCSRLLPIPGRLRLRTPMPRSSSSVSNRLWTRRPAVPAWWIE